MSTFKLNDLEIEVLRILNGEDIPGWTWGAAMSACCSSLKALGLAQGHYQISSAGKKFLADFEKETP